MDPRDKADQATKQLPARLKAARKAAKVTQDQLVTMAEFSPVALSKFERGINSPSFANFVAICHALDVSPNYLTGWDEGSTLEGTAGKQALLNQLIINANSLPDDWIEQLISIAEKAKSDQ